MSLGRTFALALSSAVLLGAGAASAQMPAPKVATSPAAAPAGDYALDPRHASAIVKLAHFGLSHYSMRFNTIAGNYSYDPKKPTASVVTVSIDPNSIDTNDTAFNKEIADKFLETGKFPTLTFTSTKIEEGKGDHGKVEGVLDFHGVKKPVTLDVTYRGSVSAMGKDRMGFSGSTSFKRSDFGAGAYVPIVGDEVTVLIEVEFVRK